MRKKILLILSNGKATYFRRRDRYWWHDRNRLEFFFFDHHVSSIFIEYVSLSLSISIIIIIQLRMNRISVRRNRWFFFPFIHCTSLLHQRSKEIWSHSTCPGWQRFEQCNLIYPEEIWSNQVMIFQWKWLLLTLRKKFSGLFCEDQGCKILLILINFCFVKLNQIFSW